MAAFADSNGLDPTAFPSLMQMENELVGVAANGSLGAPDGMVGSVTSGGTESILLAVQTARDAHPDVTRPRMVVPSTAHAAFHKAAHYFGVEAVSVDVDPTTSARTRPRWRLRSTSGTVLVVASAPSYAHGVVDDVPAIAAVAAAAGVRCHVDACIGGWVLPYLRGSGRPVTPWTFDVDGVTSISVDLHKYAYTPKGVSLLLHRDPSLRRPQYFASARWPGYTMLNSTMQSTKSGGPLAAAWAVVTVASATSGYERLAAKAFDGVDRLLEGVASLDGVEVVVRPGLDAGRARDRRQLRRVHDRRRDGGAGLVRPAADVVRRPATDAPPHAERGDAPTTSSLLEALGEAVAAARAAGPVTVDPGVAEVVRALEPEKLNEEEFDGLLAAAGLTGPARVRLALPARMAEVNALLDLASPELREAVLVAFLDRLFRPRTP